MTFAQSLALAASLLLAACGGGASAPASSAPASAKPAASTAASAKPAASAPASAKPAASGSAAASAKPAASAGASAKPAASAAPLEKPSITVALSGTGSTQLPLFIAQDAGYFKNHGLEVKIEMMAASVANQALLANSIDIYNGAASMITAHLAGADSIYIAAPSDHPQIILFGKKGVNSVNDLKGKTIAITSAGTTKDIFARYTARQNGLEVDKDIRLLFNPSEQALMATFLAGNADAALVSPPQTTQLQQQGYPILEDYGKEGLKVIEPGVAVRKGAVTQMPNTLKAYLMGYLDGTKRALEDPAYTKRIDTQTTQVTDQSVIDFDYEQGQKIWNKNLVVDKADIQVVLDGLTDPKAKAAKAEDFFDNSLINQVNAEYASKLFPGDVK